MLFSKLHKLIVNKVIFLGFMGGWSPQSPPFWIPSAVRLMYEKRTANIEFLVLRLITRCALWSAKYGNEVECIRWSRPDVIGVSGECLCEKSARCPFQVKIPTLFIVNKMEYCFYIFTVTSFTEAFFFQSFAVYILSMDGGTFFKVGWHKCTSKKL